MIFSLRLFAARILKWAPKNGVSWSENRPSNAFHLQRIDIDRLQFRPPFFSARREAAEEDGHEQECMHRGGDDDSGKNSSRSSKGQPGAGRFTPQIAQAPSGPAGHTGPGAKGSLRARPGGLPLRSSRPARYAAAQPESDRTCVRPPLPCLGTQARRRLKGPPTWKRGGEPFCGVWLRLLGGAPCFMPRHWQTTAGVFSGVSLRCIRVSGIRVSGQSGNVGRPDRTVTNSESDGFSVPSRRARHPGTMAPLRHSARRDLARAPARVQHASLRRVMPPARAPDGRRGIGAGGPRPPPARPPALRVVTSGRDSRLRPATPRASRPGSRASATLGKTRAAFLGRCGWGSGGTAGTGFGSIALR